MLLQTVLSYLVLLALLAGAQAVSEQPQRPVYTSASSMRFQEVTFSSASLSSKYDTTSDTTESGEVSPERQSENDDGNGCTSASDLNIIEGRLPFSSSGNPHRFFGSSHPSSRFYEILLSCGRRTFGNEERTAACVQDALWAETHQRLSDSCMRCFSSSVACGATNCKGPCFFSSCAAACLKVSKPCVGRVWQALPGRLSLLVV